VAEREELSDWETTPIGDSSFKGKKESGKAEKGPLFATLRRREKAKKQRAQKRNWEG